MSTWICKSAFAFAHSAFVCSFPVLGLIVIITSLLLLLHTSDNTDSHRAEVLNQKMNRQSMAVNCTDREDMFLFHSTEHHRLGCGQNYNMLKKLHNLSRTKTEAAVVFLAPWRKWVQYSLSFSSVFGLYRLVRSGFLSAKCSTVPKQWSRGPAS